jgi:BirA family biotin operon repressor/biotin-[acetyl-CoA-carboxylase] ligase
MPQGSLTADELKRGLNTRRVGRSIVVFEELDSTNRYALEQVESSEAQGLVILAEYQTAGRARMGRSWNCPRGAGILCTVVIVDADNCIDGNLLALLVPVAISEGLEDATGIHAGIRWPNDLVIDHRKVAGVLIESCPDRSGGQRYAIGFGINCLQQAGHFPADLRDRASSLYMDSTKPIDRAAVLRAVLQKLDAWLADTGRWDPDLVCARWKRRALPVGTRIRVSHEGQVFTGHVVDIDPSAALVVQLDEGARRLFPASNTTVLQSGA